MIYSRFLYGKPVDSFELLIRELADSEFASPTRSTLPLMDYWRSPGPRLGSLWHTLELPVTSTVDLRFEHATPIRAGGGKASFTDLMIVSPVSAIAVEAKWTEPPYATVSEWLTPSPTLNRSVVLDGWLGAINSATDSGLTVDLVASLPYQLIHRVASVCCVDAPIRWVVYQIFGDPRTTYYHEQLSALSVLLPARAAIGLGVYECGLNRRPAQVISAGSALRAELESVGLFDFQSSSLTVIKAAG